ncbi:MAG: Rrf2 family transcriptional regulator [Planctomycetes bacterium]|jgi:Rrf2 family protein|nr:Rrf2 family transcriptional regulator [Planctomycetota bacterium]
MLRISKKADYAVFLLGAIARQGAYPGGPAESSVVSAHEIARQAGLNKSVVANLLKEFTKHGLLESVRGLKGGYKLNRAPHEISLATILEVVEGRFTLVDCIAEHGGDHHGNDHPLHGAAAKAPSPLALAKSQHSDPAHGSGCSLSGFCPSKAPMRIVHERISHLFQQITLGELCSLPAAVPLTRATSPLPIGSQR